MLECEVQICSGVTEVLPMSREIQNSTIHLSLVKSLLNAVENNALYLHSSGFSWLDTSSTLAFWHLEQPRKRAVYWWEKAGKALSVRSKIKCVVALLASGVAVKGLGVFSRYRRWLTAAASRPAVVDTGSVCCWFHVASLEGTNWR